MTWAHEHGSLSDPASEPHESFDASVSWGEAPVLRSGEQRAGSKSSTDTACHAGHGALVEAWIAQDHPPGGAEVHPGRLLGRGGTTFSGGLGEGAVIHELLEVVVQGLREGAV